MSDVHQVYVVTRGSYSDYMIDSVWLTLDEAKREAGDYGRVEVWPIGEADRTLGTFYCNTDLDATTGQPVHGYGDPPEIASYSDLREGPPEARILCWQGRNTIGIRVTSPTAEAAGKVYSEVRARVLAQIDLGLPPEVIAESQYVQGTWHPTR